MNGSFQGFELRRGQVIISVRRNPEWLPGYTGLIDGIPVAMGNHASEALRGVLLVAQRSLSHGLRQTW
jgi:hypothetical protein